MKNRIIGISLIILTAFTTAGCALETVPDMTAEQEKLVSEYAAGLLLKYDDSFENGVLSEEQLEKAKEEERIQRERDERTRQLAQEYLEKTKAAENKNKKSSGKEDNRGAEETAEINEVIDRNGLAGFLGLDGLAMSYEGFKTAKSYPESGNNVFSVDAANGRELVLVNIKIKNTTSGTLDIDMFNSRVNFNLKLNDGSIIPSSSTLLLDDFSIYKDSLAAGASVDTILLFEANESADLNSASVEIVAGDKKGNMQIN